MRILVVGSGAREHALAWRLARDGHAVVAAPGNPGLDRVAACRPVPAGDRRALAALCRDERIELVVVGPEAPLAEGLADTLGAAGVPVFGPSAAAARLESSKVFAKEFLARHGLPTAPFEVVDDVERAVAAATGFGYPAVLKADGLAAGKGVAIVRDAGEARAFAFACLVGNRFGPAGARLVVEQFLPGEEASLFFLSDGADVSAFVPARDYKRLADGDQGPNTGGMGAYAPAPLDPAIARRVQETIARPTVAGLAGAGTPFRGLLYVGLMIGPDGPRVLEYNVRFGDPETQVLMPLVEGDLGARFLECATGRLSGPLTFAAGATVGVVLAAEGYPEAPRTGAEVKGLADWPDPAAEDVARCWCFHAGTRRADGRLVAAGGRVVTVVAHAADVAQARQQAYAGVARLDLAGGRVRRDIALERSPVSP